MWAAVRAVCFVLVFCVLFVWVSYLLRSDHYDRRSIASFYAEPKDSLDVVYIGGSSCLAYWAPMEAWHAFGFTSYDFGASSIPPQTVQYCVIEALKTQNPEVVVIDLRPFEYGSEKDENGEVFMYREPNIRLISDGFKYSWNRFKLIQNSVPRGTSTLPYHFDIAKYHTNVEALGDGSYWRYSTYRQGTFRKGFRTTERFKPIEREDYSTLAEKMPLAPTQQALLEELLDYVEKQQLQVLFVVPPYAMEKEHQMKFNTMREMIEARGHGYLNWNEHFEETGLDVDADYYDPSHVNVFGAEKYTLAFGEYLVANYGLQDKRGQEAYWSWDDDYVLWAEEFAATKAIIEELRQAPPGDGQDTGEAVVEH